MALRVAGVVTDAWASEDIPDDGTLYRWVRQEYFKYYATRGTVSTSAFTNYPSDGGMSTDWTKYCAGPDDTRRRSPDPPRHGVVELDVSAIRNMHLAAPDRIALQQVIHAPTWPDNRAHTDVYGRKDAAAMRQYQRLCRVVLFPDAD
jgi:hypothetical protein